MAATGQVLTATAICAVACVAASPCLARLTLSVPDRDMPDWWRGRSASRRRVVVCAVVGLVLGALAGAASGGGALTPAFGALALIGSPLTVIDIEHHRLPNRLVHTAAVSGLVLLSLAAAVRDAWAPLLHAGEGALAAYAVLFLLAFAAPGSFGLGDVKLGGVLGGYLGWFGWARVYYGLLAGFVLGAAFAIALLVTRRASMKSALAFGPMLLAGAMAVLALDAFDLAPSGFL